MAKLELIASLHHVLLSCFALPSKQTKKELKKMQVEQGKGTAEHLMPSGDWFFLPSLEDYALSLGELTVISSNPPPIFAMTDIKRPLVAQTQRGL